MTKKWKKGIIILLKNSSKTIFNCGILVILLKMEKDEHEIPSIFSTFFLKIFISED